MSAMASQITSLTIAYSTVYSGADQRKYQSSASLAFVRGIHRRPVNSPHKGPVTRKMFPFDDVIMYKYSHMYASHKLWTIYQCWVYNFCLLAQSITVQLIDNLIENSVWVWVVWGWLSAKMVAPVIVNAKSCKRKRSGWDYKSRASYINNFTVENPGYITGKYNTKLHGE